MIILTLRTDKPEAEIGLFDDKTELAYQTWQAHRKLAETIHQQIEVLLKTHHKEWHDIEGIVGFQGPGSFTGLRIGLTVANALAASLQVPIVGSAGKNWQQEGITRLIKKQNDQQIIPEYGSLAHITPPKS
jgi:tRNA threonylcarbamoyladenosine biosynthesis protein TsaB